MKAIANLLANNMPRNVVMVDGTTITVLDRLGQLKYCDIDLENGSVSGMAHTLYYNALTERRQYKDGIRLVNHILKDSGYAELDMKDTSNISVKEEIASVIMGLFAESLLNNDKTTAIMSGEELLSVLRIVSWARPECVDDCGQNDAVSVMLESSYDMWDVYTNCGSIYDVTKSFSRDEIEAVILATIRDVLGKRGHRGVMRDTVNVLKASIASIAAPIAVTDMVDSDGNVVVCEDGHTPFPDFSVNATPVMYEQFPTNRVVKQQYNNLFRMGSALYEEMGVDTKDIPTFIYVNMEKALGDKDRITKAIKDMEDSGNTNNIMYAAYKAAMQWSGNTDIEDLLDSIIVDGVLRFGFDFQGRHYTYVLSTQSQFRGGVGTFMYDPNNDGWKFSARMLYKLTDAPHYKSVIGNAEDMDELEGANYIFKNLQKYTAKFRNDDFTADKDGHYKVALSKLLGRFGLTASSAVELRAIADSNNSEAMETAKDILANARIWTVNDAEVSHIVSGKTLELYPQEEKDGATHGAKVVDVTKNVTETVADGGGMIGPRVGAAVTYLKGYLKSDEFMFFVNKFAKFDDDLAIVKSAADGGNDDAKELVRIALIIRSCTQVRFDKKMTGIKGMLEMVDFRSWTQAWGVKDENGIALAEYDMILPESTVKYLVDNAQMDASNMWVCNTNKTRDVDTMSRMSAQYVSDLSNWTGDDADKVADMIIDELVSSVNMPKNDVNATLKAVIAQGLVGRGSEISVFNRAPELVKANLVMAEDKNYLKYETETMGRAMSDSAKGSIPSKGGYSFLAFDPNEAFNCWFETELADLGLKPRETLREYANAQGINGPVCYMDGYKGEIALFRSPSNSPYEAQVCQGINMPELWYMNDCVIVSAIDGTARRLGGADHDGDKVKPVKDNTPINKLIVKGVDRNAPELLIDLKAIADMMGDKRTPKMALTVENNVELLGQILHHSRIGEISKWSMAWAGFGAHLNEAERIAKANGCNGFFFVVPTIESLSWENAMGDSAMRIHDIWHNEAVHFMRHKDDKEGTKAIDTFHVNPKSDKNFKGYEVKDGILYVEGYVEYYTDRMTGLQAPRKDKVTGQYIGWYGAKTFEEVEAKAIECRDNNLIDGAAQGVEIDATNNGFGSFFHKKAHFMAVHELYRDFLKDKKLNPNMVCSTYISISPLGVLFTKTMTRWNDVMNHIDEQKARNMTGYMSLLCGDNEINNLFAAHCDVAIEDIRKEYLMEMENINAYYGDDDDEQDDKIQATKRLIFKTKARLMSLTHNTNVNISVSAIALAVWASGNGGSFSFIMADELREMLKNDPTAFGIEKLPRSFDKKNSKAYLKHFCGATWLTTEKTIDHGENDEIRIEEICQVNGKGGNNGKCKILQDVNGRSYAIFMRDPSEDKYPWERSRSIGKDMYSNLSVNLVGRINIVDIMALRNYVDTSIQWKNGGTKAGYIKVSVFMDEHGVMNWNKEGTNWGGKVEFSVADNTMPSFAANMVGALLNKRDIILDLTSATISKAGYIVNTRVNFAYKAK